MLWLFTNEQEELVCSHAPDGGISRGKFKNFRTPGIMPDVPVSRGSIHSMRESPVSCFSPRENGPISDIVDRIR